MAGLLVNDATENWTNIMATLTRSCFEQLVRRSMVQAAPVTVAGFYQSLFLAPRDIVMLHALFLELEHSMRIPQRAFDLCVSFHGATACEYLEYVCLSLEWPLDRCLSRAVAILQQHQLLQCIPALQSFDVGAMSSFEQLQSLPLSIVVPLALASVQLLADSDVDDDWVPTLHEASEILQRMRECFSVYLLLTQQAQVWASQHDLDLELVRQNLVTAVHDLRAAGAGLPATSRVSEQRVRQLTEQLQTALEQIDRLQQQLGMNSV
jgi:hypothetical protein